MRILCEYHEDLPSVSIIAFCHFYYVLVFDDVLSFLSEKHNNMLGGFLILFSNSFLFFMDNLADEGCKNFYLCFKSVSSHQIIIIAVAGRKPGCERRKDG